MRVRLDEFAHRAHLAGRQHEIVGRVRLQDRMHALDIVASVAPVALGLEIAEIDGLFEAELDAGDAARDLARDEGLAADRALMIEQDAVRGIHAVGLAVIDRNPVAIQLGDAVRRARVERRGFLLRHLLNQAVKFRG